jgi:hypothetical protein
MANFRATDKHRNRQIQKLFSRIFQIEIARAVDAPHNYFEIGRVCRQADGMARFR